MKKYVPEVCVDTNVVIALANIKNQIQEEIDIYDENHTLLSLCELLTKIKNKEIIAYITPTVQKEIIAGTPIFGTDTYDFVKDSNIIPIRFSGYDKKSFACETERIAEMYSRKISSHYLEKIANNVADKKENLATCVFKPKKCKGKLYPINDSRVMAEASQLGLILITNDKKDFIDKHRPELISCINKLLQLNFRSKPYTSRQLCTLLENNIKLPSLAPEIRKIMSFRTTKNSEKTF